MQHKANCHKLLKMTFLFVTPLGHLSWEKFGGRRDSPTSHPNAPGTHEHKWLPRRCMVHHYTPQPGTCKPFWHPHIQMKGCHVGGDGYLQGLGDGQGGSLLCQYASLSCSSRGFGFNLPGLLRGQLRYSGSRGLMMSLGRGWGQRTWGNVIENP